MLEVGSDLVASSQVKKEREGVNVSSSSQEHCQLGGDEVKERAKKLNRSTEPSSHYLLLLLTNRLAVGTISATEWC